MPPLPPPQTELIAEIRELYFSGLDDALDTLDDRVAKRARIAMQRIRQSNYNASVIKRESRWMVQYTNDQTMALVADQIRYAALYAQRAADVARAYVVAGRIKDAGEHLSVSESAIARARMPGVSSIDAEAMLSRIKLAPLRTRKEVKKALEEYGAKQARATYTGPRTTGTKVMGKLRKVGLVRPSPEIGLSERLHGAAARNLREVEKAVGTAIREGSSLNKGARDLINTLNRAGDPLSIKREITKPMQRMRQAARDLQKLSVNQGDSQALRDATAAFDKEWAKFKRIVAKRVDQRAGYLEAKQKLDVEGQLKTAKAPYRVLKVRKKAYEQATH